MLPVKMLLIFLSDARYWILHSSQCFRESQAKVLFSVAAPTELTSCASHKISLQRSVRTPRVTELLDKCCQCQTPPTRVISWGERCQAPAQEPLALGTTNPGGENPRGLVTVSLVLQD